MSKAKYIIFILGLAVIGGIFAIVNLPLPEGGLPANSVFFWISLCIIYVVFFVPLLFSTMGKGADFDAKIPSGIILWISVFVFEIVALVVSISVFANVLSIRIAATFDLVVFFVCAVFIFFGSVSGSKIKQVQSDQSAAKSQLTTVRSSLDLLKIKVGSLGEDYLELKKAVLALSDDARYLSPIDNERSLVLENQMTNLISNLTALIDSAVLETNRSSVDQTVGQLQSLMQQRKSLYL